MMLAPVPSWHDLFANLISPPLFFRDKKEATAYTLSDIVKIK